jgi:predicted RNA-binding Zn ribbon-like protein
MRRTDGPKFFGLGEHPAIEFANTVSTPDGQLEDLLCSWPDVVSWFSKSSSSQDPSLNLTGSRGVEALKSVLKLREAWKATLAQLIEGGKVSDEFLESINRLLAEDNFHEALHRDGDKGFHLERSAVRLQGEKLGLAILASQIADFLANANLNYLHRCANTKTCTLYFYDTTKNHRRRWCSVAACGNRHKVAAFRSRQKKSSRKEENLIPASPIAELIDKDRT